MLVDKEKALGLCGAIRTDYSDLVERELDTDGEIERQSRLIANFKALEAALAPVPADLAGAIHDVLAKLGSWDVYAFWFKEVKELVTRVQGVLDRCKAHVDPVTTKPPVPAQPGTATKPAPLRPVPPQSPARPAPPVSPASLSSPVADLRPDHGSISGRTLPILKPVFKVPPRVVPVQEASVPPAPAGEVTGTPVPLRAVLDGSKTPLHVKPARLIKPIISAGSPAARTGPLAGISPPGQPAAASEPVMARPAPVNPLAMTPVDVGAAREVPPSPIVKPALIAAKPLRIPKPVKISVPSLDDIDIQTEISLPSMQDRDTGDAPHPTALDRGPRPVPIQVAPATSPPSGNRLGPLPVRIPMQDPVAVQGPASDEGIIDEIAGEVMARIAQEKDGSRPADVPTRPAGGPVRIVMPSRFGEGAPPGDAQDAKIDVISHMLEGDGDWDEAAIGAMLDGDAAEPAPGPAATGDGTTASSFSDALLRAKPAHEPSERANPASSLLSVFTPKEPFSSKKDTGKKDAKTSKDDAPLIKTPPSPAPMQPATASTDLFASALASRTRGLAPAPSRAPLFGDAGASGKQEPVVPLGSDVDLESLPDTKDGLYQTLIALEGKRYSLERARKDLRADLDRGIIKDVAYQQRMNELKADLDSIAGRIADIRERLKGR